MFQPPPGHVEAGPLPILVSLPERAPQRRWTVAIRLILALPLSIVVFFVDIATAILVVIGWFGALFMGRAPNFTRDMVTVLLRMTLNLTAYAFLLTDTYPPFSGEDPDYPIQMAVPTATRLNRAAVFFRIILAIPAAIVSSVVSYGLAVLLFPLWLITLITGRLPQTAHGAICAIVRFETRYSAYQLLLVPTYPGRLFGDSEQRSPSAVLPQTTLPPLSGMGGAPPIVAPLSAAPPAVPQAAPQLETSWTLTLGTGARRLLFIMIVLGSAAYIGQITLQAVLSNRLNQQNQLNSAINTLNTQFEQFATNTADCQGSSDLIACAEGTARTLSQNLSSFATDIAGLQVLGVSQGALNTAVNEARTDAGLFAKLADAGPTQADYRFVSAAIGIQSHLNALQNDINAL